MNQHFSSGPGGEFDLQASPVRRPRSQRAHDAVLGAASALMHEEPLVSITVDQLARRSGVSTATIYKHWPCKTAILAEAFGQQTAAAVPARHSGDPIADLIVYAVELTAFYDSPDGGAYRELLAACALDPQAAPYFHAFFLDGRRRTLEHFWRRAISSGAVRPGLDPSAASDVLLGSVAFRLLSGHAPLTEADVRRLVDYALHGLLADEPTTSRSSAPSQEEDCP